MPLGLPARKLSRAEFANEFDDIGGLRKAADAVARVNHFSARGNVEHAALAFDECGLYA